MKRISGYSADPQELLRTVTIDGASIEDILKELPEKDRSPFPLFDFDYDKFLIDIFHHSERIFYFRGHYYFIDYWGPDSDAFWTPGWIFFRKNHASPSQQREPEPFGPEEQAREIPSLSARYVPG